MAAAVRWRGPGAWQAYLEGVDRLGKRVSGALVHVAISGHDLAFDAGAPGIRHREEKQRLVPEAPPAAHRHPLRSQGGICQAANAWTELRLGDRVDEPHPVAPAPCGLILPHARIERIAPGAKWYIGALRGGLNCHQQSRRQCVKESRSHAGSGVSSLADSARRTRARSRAASAATTRRPYGVSL